MTAQSSNLSAGPAPSWGDQTGFFQRGRPAFWMFVVTLVVCSLDFLGQQLNFISTAPDAWLVTIILLVPYAIPVIAIIYYLDLYEREPLSIMVAGFLWGGIAATTLSMYTNTPLDEVIFKITGSADFTQAWGAALTAPFVEEGFKALGVILLVAIAREEFDDILDGFVWGAMVGIGFLLVEDVFYFVRAFVNDGGNWGSIIQMFMIRILGAGPYSHFLYTGLVGMGIAYYQTRTDVSPGRRLMMGLLYAAAGVGAHFFWNSPLLGFVFDFVPGIIGLAVFMTLKGLPMLIGLIVVLKLARNRERRWFAAFSQTFFDDGAITPAELGELSGLRARRRARKAAGAAKGPMGEKLKGQIQRQQINLAMAMSKFGSEQHPEVARQQALVIGLKTQLVGMGAAPVATVAWGGAATGGAAPAWGQPVQPAPTAQPAPSGWGQQPAQSGVAQPAAATWSQPAPAPVQPAQPGPVEPAPATAEPAQPVEPAPATAQPGPVEPAPATAQPGPVAPPVPAQPAWAPTHLAAPEGLPAWATPDPSRAPAANLAGGLELVISERAGDWARVTAVNGWTGWVDARRLVARG